MKIPVIEEIKITTVEPHDLIDHFRKYRVGETPLYTDFTHLSIERLQEVIGVMSHCLRKINISPVFPYPFYVITKYDYIESEFPLVTDKKYLPKYFDVDVNRMTNKEQKLLDKIDTISSQIRNQDIKKRLEEYKLTVIPQKVIKALAKEGHFLEKVSEDLKKK